MRRVLGACLLVAGVLAAPATASGRLDHYVMADGYGQLVAQSMGGPVGWERCSPDGGCVPVDDGDADGQVLSPGPQPAGVFFRAHHSGGVDQSEVWRGTLRVVRPPAVTGEVRVGGRVGPVAAGWEGGWGREADWLQLQACPAPGGPGCRVILDRIKHPCGSPAGRRLPARYAGWWLQVADARIDVEQPFTAEGYLVPEGIRPLTAAPGVAVALAGQIGSGRAPRGDCLDVRAGLVRVRRVLHLGARPRLAVARVDCPFRCTVTIDVRQGGRTQVTLRRRLTSRATTIRLPRTEARRRLRPGPVRIHVEVDGAVAVPSGRATVRRG